MARGKILRIARPLDADDVGAPVGKLAHADRAGPRMRQIENDETFEGAGSGLVHGHGYFLIPLYCAMIALARAIRFFGVARTLPRCLCNCIP